MPDVPFVPLTSEGVTLIYGRDERAIEAAKLLKDHLDVTVLITPPGDAGAAARHRFPGGQGHDPLGQGPSRRVRTDGRRLRRARAVLARRARVSARRATARCRAATSCSISPAARRCFRPPICATAICAPIRAIRPRCCAPCSRRAISSAASTSRATSPFTEDLCAHSRSKIVGCRRCLDLCPTGAITPDGDHVAIDAQHLRRLRPMRRRLPDRRRRLRAAAGRRAAAQAAHAARRPTARPAASTPIVLLHDDEHGGELIDALARHGDGLPANVLPLQVNEVTQVGLEAVAAAFAYGACAVRFLLRAKPRHDVAGLRQDHRAGRADPRRARLCRRARRHDRDRRSGRARRSACAPSRAMDGAAKPATFSAVGGKRDVVRLALRELHRAAPAPVDIVPLPEGAPFGTVEVNVEGCTLCLSCVSACPTGALSDDPERPMLRFAEDACVQCGLCKATCPEKVITLKPQLDFRAATASAACSRRKSRSLHPLRQAVRRQEHGRARRRQARRQALDVQGLGKRGSTSSRCATTAASPRWPRRISIRSARRRPAVRTTDDYLREREQQGRRLNVYFFIAAFSQKLHQRLAILGRADFLLRHLGAGRVGHRADLEQLRHRLRRPDDVELLERRRKIVARQRRDPAAENAGERRPGAVAFVGRQRVAGDAGAEHLRAGIAGIGRERIVGRADRDGADRLAGRPRPSGGSCGRCRR